MLRRALLAALLIASAACANGDARDGVDGSDPQAAAPRAVEAVPTAPTEDAFTPAVLSVLAAPEPVRGSDGRYHLVYELLATNATRVPWDLASVTVRDAASGTELQRIAGATVADKTTELVTRAPTNRIESGQTVVTWIALSFEDRQAVPRAVEHELVLDNGGDGNPLPPRITEIGGWAAVGSEPAVVLGPPLEGDRWVAADGCCTSVRHVRSMLPVNSELHVAQRFAIDWEQFDEQGRLFVGPQEDVDSWFGYGANVLAVADGTVVRVVDGMPNQVPGALPQRMSLPEADGNHVVLDIGVGRFVLFAHLVPGSVTVEVGQRVTAGEVIGQVGNSGNTSAPHLHLHVMATPSTLGSNGRPYTFSRFEVTGRVASTEAFDRAESTGEPVETTDQVRLGERVEALTLDQVIVSWGPAAGSGSR